MEEDCRRQNRAQQLVNCNAKMMTQFIAVGISQRVNCYIVSKCKIRKGNTQQRFLFLLLRVSGRDNPNCQQWEAVTSEKSISHSRIFS